MGAREIGREDGAAEAVGGVVGAADGFVLGGETGDDDKGAEDLLAGDAHVVGHVGEDGRGDEEPFAADVLVRFTADGQRRAFGFARRDVPHHALVLCFGDLRSLEGGVIEGVADFGGGGEG